MAQRCTHCNCDETEHEAYWHCAITGGDVCDICCLHDMGSADTPQRIGKTRQEITQICAICGRRSA